MPEISLRYQHAKDVAEAHTNVNTLEVLVSILQSRTIHGARMEKLAEKLIAQLRKEQQHQLDVFEKLSGYAAHAARAERIGARRRARDGGDHAQG